MSQGQKRLEKMRLNPLDDWRVEDVQVVCRAFGVACEKPNKTSHFGVSDPTQTEILTIVSGRPVKAIYIKKLVAFIDDVQSARAKAAENRPAKARLKPKKGRQSYGKRGLRDRNQPPR